MKKQISKILLSAMVLCSAVPSMAQWTVTGTVVAPTVLTNNVSVGTTVNGANIYAEKANAVTMGIKSQSAGATMFMDKGSATANAAFAYKLSGTTIWNSGMLGNSNYSIRNVALNSFPLLINSTNDNISLCTAAGNVGIGTNAPDYKLKVSGDAMFNGVRVGKGSGAVSSNTGVGGGVLNSNTTGERNTGAGFESLRLNTTGSFNCAFGTHALMQNTAGSNNSAFGENALNSNTASFNSAFGRQALYSNTTGTNNTAAGYAALQSNEQGSNNSAFGANAMFSNGKSENNTAVGFSALTSNVSGSHNTATGVYSLPLHVLGVGCTANGFQALKNDSIGNYNTGIGAFADVKQNNLTNATSLGFEAIATASNLVMLGNTSVTAVKAAGSFVIYSDGRFKNNVQENVPGLDFINLLNPVTYNYNIHALNKFIGANTELHTDKNIEDAIMSKEKKLYSGFIAQDVEVAAHKLGYDFSGVYKPQNESDPYGLSYADFTVPLVKAVQELSKQNEELKNEIADMKKYIETICNNSLQIKTSNPKQETMNCLQQNQPNPFGETTILNYSLASDARNAQVVIRSLNGKLVKSITLSSTDKGKITIDARELSSGTYTYTLMVNNKSVDTKLMVVTR